MKRAAIGAYSLIVATLVVLNGTASTVRTATGATVTLTPEEAKAVAKEAYIYGFPIKNPSGATGTPLIEVFSTALGR